MIVDCDIRQRNALFDLGSLADIRRLQIALCESDLSKPDNGETKSEWLKRDCIHSVAVTLPRFSILRYQIIQRTFRIVFLSFRAKSTSPWLFFDNAFARNFERCLDFARHDNQRRVRR